MPNQYIRNTNGIMIPYDIDGTDVTNALGLSSTVAEVSSYIEAVPSLSSQVDTNTSNISTLSSDIENLNSTQLSSQIDTLSSDVESLSTTQQTNISNIATLSSDVQTNTTDISNLNSEVSNLDSEVSANTSDISTLSTEVETNTSDISSISSSLNQPLQTLDGTTAGTVTYQMTSINNTGHFVASFNGYENDSAVNQTIVFPTPFSQTPMLLSNISGLVLSVSTTELTIGAPDSTALFSGAVIIDGII